MKVYTTKHHRDVDNIPGLTGIVLKDDSVLNITLNGTLMCKIPTVSHRWFLFERTPVFFNRTGNQEEEEEIL